MTGKKVPHIDSAELHRRADKGLGESAETAETEPRSVSELQRALHELGVYKIVLEAQNAELGKARDEVEAMLEKYTDLYEFAPVGYFTLDRKGTIHTVNLASVGLLGVERSRLNGRRFEHFVTDRARPAFAAFLEKIFTSFVKETCEMVLLKVGDSQLFVQIEAVAAASEQECRVALIDITERKRAEEALLKVEEAAVEALLNASKGRKSSRGGAPKD